MRKTYILAAVAALSISTSAAANDLNDILGAIATVTTGVQTAQEYQGGRATVYDVLQVGAGTANAYGNSQVGRAALGGAAVARVLAGQQGGAIDPTYTAMSQLGSLASPKGASIGTAIYSATGALGMRGRAANDVNPVPVQLVHPALAPAYTR